MPFGIVGGRLYHVMTTWQPYFGEGGHPLNAFKIWQGGLGIWGAVALGALGAWIGCRRRGVPFLRFADCAAPGIAVAQALGRFGNYFNNELYGARTNLPWGLEIHQWDQAAGHAVRGADGAAVVLGTFQPTFLYESIWCLVVAATIVWAERRFGLAHGRVFALYVMLYTVGRGVIEMLRTDEANHILGLRLNVWTSVIVFLGALYGFWRAGRQRVTGRCRAEVGRRHSSTSVSVSGLQRPIWQDFRGRRYPALTTLASAVHRGSRGVSLEIKDGAAPWLPLSSPHSQQTRGSTAPSTSTTPAGSRSSPRCAAAPGTTSSTTP